MHEFCDERHKELGPIFKERLGPQELVFLADTKMIQTAIANEGPRPHHSVPEAWLFYNKLKGIKRGLFFQTGESWSKLRKVFNKVMMADAKSSSRFTKDLLSINDDLFKSWAVQGNANSDNHIVIDDILPDLCKWSIESTGLILFGARMGCIIEHSYPKSSYVNNHQSCEDRAGQLVENVKTMFQETSKLQVLPVEIAHRFNLGPWRRFEKASDNMLRIAHEYAAEFISKSKCSNAASDFPSLLNDLIKSGSLTDEEISQSVTDLIIAAADTTSNSLQWMIYAIARFNHVQALIYEEVAPLFDLLINSEDISETSSLIRERAPYLTGFVKEVMRLYPTAPFLARTLDHEIVLDNYLIPPKVPIVFSLYTTSRMSKYFKDPLAFQPERWLRTRENDDITVRKHAYASLPFGVGARMCIGRRAADLEICLFMISIISKFTCELVDPDPIGTKLKMVMCPERPIGLRLKSRK